MAGSEFTTKDIRQFITSVLLVGSILKVDDQGAVYWKGAEEDEPVILELAGGGKGSVFTYTTQATKPDAIIVNPFAEHVTISADRKWFYKVTSTIFSGSLIRVMDYLLNMAMTEKECAYPELMMYITPIVGKVDEKMIQEFKYISDVGTDDFCTISYNTKAKETRMFLGIEDPTGDFQKAIPTNKVRKKSWEVFQTLLKSIFRTQGPVSDEMKNSTCLIVCPQFRTYMEIWLSAWKAIAPVLLAIETHDHEDLPVLLQSIEEHIGRIDEYQRMCKWSAGASPAATVKAAVKKLEVPGYVPPTPPAQQQCCHTHAAGTEQPIPTPTYPGQQHGHPIPEPQHRPGSRWDTPQTGYPQMGQPVPAFMPAPIQPQVPAGPGSRWNSPTVYPPQQQQFGFGAPVNRQSFGDPNYQQVHGRPVFGSSTNMFGVRTGSLLNPLNQ